MQDFAASIFLIEFIRNATFTCGTEDLTELMVQGCRVPGSQGCNVPEQGFKVAGFHTCRGSGCRFPQFQGCCIVPRFQEYEVPRSEGSKIQGSKHGSKIPRLHASWDWNPTESLLRCCEFPAFIYISNCISNSLMCKHFGPLKCKLNATFSGHSAKICCQKTLKNLWHSQA